MQLGEIGYALSGRGALMIDLPKYIETKALNPVYRNKDKTKAIQHNIDTYDTTTRVVVVFLYNKEFDICMVGKP